VLGQKLNIIIYLLNYKIKEVMHNTSPTVNQQAEEKEGIENQVVVEEEKVDNRGNQEEEKEKVVKTSPAINEGLHIEGASEKVNSSEGELSVFSELIVKLVMTDGQPFHTLETAMYPFLRTLRPDVRLPSISELKKDFIRVHQKEKTRLKKILKKHRVCLSTETWFDRRQRNHMSIRAHWINEEWELCSNVLTFRWVPPVNEEYKESVDELSEIWEKCLKDWGIKSVLTITVGKTYTEDGAVQYLRTKTKDEIGTFLGNEFLQVRSCAHVISEVVKEGLEAFKETVCLIQNTIKFVGSGEV
jgi:hypothetical protein